MRISIVVVLLVAGVAACKRKPTSAPPAPPAAQSTQDVQEAVVSPVAADTITIGTYAQFVRPLRNLGVQPSNADDFRPYNADIEPDTFSFVVGADQYIVGPGGAGRLVVTDLAPRAFSLPVDSGFFVERLAFTRMNGDPVFVVQETDNEGGTGFIVRLDSASLEQRWNARVPGFNIGFALRDGRFLYVTCFGFVGKLDLESGQYTWRHDDLYSTEKFNDFDHPRITGDTVEFPTGGRTIRVVRQTGQRLLP